jgi:hypothetical protein
MRKTYYYIPLIAIIAVLLAVLAFANAGSAQQVTEPLASAGQPITSYATRSDTYGPLYNIPPITPRWADLIEIPRKTLPNRPADPGTPGEDTVVQGAVGSSAGTTLLSFEGINNVNGVLPPDTQGDVGPNHYVQVVNISFAIWDRDGNKLYGPANINTIFSGFGGPCESTNDGDPIVLYDHLADRWMISQFALPNYPRGPFYQCIAISKTSDPTGSYHRYEFTLSDSKMNDYPKFGVWSDGYYMSINQFYMPFGIWAGQGAVVFERDKMLNGDPARMVYFDLYNTDSNLGGMLPADLDGPVPPDGAPNPFIERDDNSEGFSQDQLQIWNFHVDWNNTNNSTFTKMQELATSPFDTEMCGGSRNCIPQPGGYKVDAIADRLMYRLQYRNFGDHEAMVVNHTVDVDGSDHAGIRWYELRKTGSSWSIYQEGTFAPDANHRWMGSVAMNGRGDIALGYSVSSTSIYPSIRYTGRLAGDPLGQMTLGEGTIVNGDGYQDHDSGRWGDYSMMSVDPVDDCSFWYTQEYYMSRASGNADWQTRVGKIQLSDCGGSPPPTATPTEEPPTPTPTYTSEPPTPTPTGEPPTPTPTSEPPTPTPTNEPPTPTPTTPPPTETPTPVPSGTMHIGDLDGSSSGSRRWSATVTIMVHDANENPVANATVYGTWDYRSISADCTTDSTGTCSVTLNWIRPSLSSVTFTVDDITHDSLTYDALSNHDPDGDSDGTSIVVYK